MPIVDLEKPSVVGSLGAMNKVVTPGKVDVDLGSDAPDWSTTFGAAFRQDNIVGSYLSSAGRGIPNDPEPGFNPWDSIKGTKYEDKWDSFIDVRNVARADAVKRQIDQESDDRKLLSAAPWYKSLPAQMVAGTLDLTTLLPGGAIVRGAKGGVAIGKSALSVGAASGFGTLAQETALQSIQETRELSESAQNIGFSVLAGGILGAAASKLLSPAEWSKAVADLERGFQSRLEPGMTQADGMPSPASAGAAAVEPTDLTGNTIAGKAAGAVASVTSRLNPLLRGLDSPSPVYRETLTKLVENTLYLRKNIEGVASEPAVETLMKEHNAGLAKSVSATDEAFSAYVKSQGGGKLAEMFPRRHGLLTAREFREEIGRAMRRGDESDIPEVAQAAKAWRTYVFDPLKEAAIKAGQLPEDVSVETAMTYFSRMWNRNKLIAREGRFKQIATDWIERETPKWRTMFDQETAERASKLKDEKLRDFLTERRVEREARFDDPQASAREIADAVFNTLTGKVDGGPRPEFLTVKARGPLKERTFNIPDELVEEFLESDVDVVGRRYTRIMGADVEMANKFGSVDLKDQIAKINEDYQRLRSGVTDEKELKRLDDRHKRDIGDLETLRDLLRNTQAPGGRAEQNYGRAVRIVNHLNYLRSMGEVALASVAESVRPAMVHGLRPYMQTIGHLATNLHGIKLSVAEAQLAGNVSEKILGQRLATLSEIVDPYATRGPTEAFVENMTNVASKWNGIRMLTDMQKAVSSVMTQNRIIGNALEMALERRLAPPDVPDGYVRFYHGYDSGLGEGGSRWITPDRDYAANFRGKKQVAYVDIKKGTPEEIALRNWDEIDEQGRTNMVGRYKHGEIPETLAKQLKPEAVESASSMRQVSDREKAYMAYLGIDESMAGRIAKQFDEFGLDADGVKVANTEQWTDPQAVRAFRAALNKDVDSIITTKGVADTPLFANTPTGRMFLQFKSFALASHQRVLLRGLQEDQTRFLSGLIAMSTIGMMTTYLKAISGNREEKLADFSTNPGWWISEGLDKSGVLSVPMELSNIFEKLTTLNPIKTPLKAGDEGSRLSQRMQNRSGVGALLGPTIGFGDDVITAAGIPGRVMEGEDVSKAQKSAAERLLPFNSYLGLRQLLRYVVFAD